VKGLAEHPARIGAEITRGELPTKGGKARIELQAGLFEATFQFFHDFVEILLHDSLPSTRKQPHAQMQGSFA
jgi:hypothetical protein